MTHVALVLLFAVAPPDRAAEVRAVLVDQAVAWNRGDLDRFLASYWDDDEVTFYSGGKVSKGFKALRDRYHKRYRADGAEMGKLTFSNLDVVVFSDGHAIARGRWGLVRKKDRPGGLFTLWLRRFPGGWKIVHDHTSADEAKP